MLRHRCEVICFIIYRKYKKMNILDQMHDITIYRKLYPDVTWKDAVFPGERRGPGEGGGGGPAHNSVN